MQCQETCRGTSGGSWAWGGGYAVGTQWCTVRYGVAGKRKHGHWSCAMPGSVRTAARVVHRPPEEAPALKPRRQPAENKHLLAPTGGGGGRSRVWKPTHRLPRARYVRKRRSDAIMGISARHTVGGAACEYATRPSHWPPALPLRPTLGWCSWAPLPQTLPQNPQCPCIPRVRGRFRFGAEQGLEGLLQRGRAQGEQILQKYAGTSRGRAKSRARSATQASSLWHTRPR